MENLEAKKIAIKKRLIDDLRGALVDLEELLPEQSDKYNDVLMLFSALNGIDRQMMRGTVEQSTYQIEINKLTENTLTFIDHLTGADFTQEDKSANRTDLKKGFVLYQIPVKMQVQRRYKCSIKIALRKELLMEELSFKENVTIKDIRISEVMGVDLLDLNSDQAFDILSISGKEQFLDSDFSTEWLYYVTPKQTGSFLLLLKVTVIELVNDRERKRELVLEEFIDIVAEEVKEDKWSRTYRAAGFLLVGPAKGIISSKDSSEKQKASQKKSIYTKGAAIAGVTATAVILLLLFGIVFLQQNPSDNSRNTLNIAADVHQSDENRDAEIHPRVDLIDRVSEDPPVTDDLTPESTPDSHKLQRSIDSIPPPLTEKAPVSSDKATGDDLSPAPASPPRPTAADESENTWDTLTFHLNFLRKRGDSDFEINSDKISQNEYRSLQDRKGEAEKACAPCYKLIRDNEENLLSEGRFFQKCPIGVYIEYHPNSKVKLRGNWSLKEGMQFADITDKNCSVKDGKWIYFYESGKVQREEFYIKGVKNGPWLYYSTQGHTTGLIEYKNGEIVKQVGKAN